MKLSGSSLRQRAEQALNRVQQAVRRHPRRLAVAAVAGLGGFAVTAFGIAPMVPDAADLPRRLVSEPMALPADLSAQIDALAAHDLVLSRSDLTRGSDSAESLLRRLGVADPAAAAYIRGDREARRLIEGRAGKMVQAEVTRDGTLQSLVARYPDASGGDEAARRFQRLTIRRDGGAFTTQLELAALEPQARLASGTIRSSLFAATDEAGLPDAIATQMAEMFATDIDFHRALRKGDTFSLVYEALTADGLPVAWGEGAGRVLAAEFVNNGKSYQSVWFDGGRGKGAYFGFDGQSKRRAFLASPLAFSRVTSGFAMRFHPIFRTWRAHLGTDYAAPTGTPVRSVGDGVVEFAGRQNGYGNVVTLKHDAKRSTVYAHLSRIDVRVGQRIEQGQIVGAVGATGWATGPHLHFEFRVDGQHQDPQLIARAAETMQLDAASKPRFMAWARQLKAELDAADNLAGYRLGAE